MKTVRRMYWKLLTVITPVLLLMVLGQSRSYASHFAAGEIFLTYIGEGADGCSNTSEYKYLLTVDLYRACEGGADAPTTAFINYGSVNGGFTGSINMTEYVPDTLHELCEVFVPQNSCITPANQNTYPAYIRHRFTDTLILPSAQTDWLFSYSSCCRNGGIANGSSNGSFYIETGLNNLTKYNNSTPRFLVEPLPYICAMQPAQYLNGPFDLNGDSMFTRVQEPLGGANNPILYGPAPYTVNDPMGSTAGGPFQFDPATATASFTPSNQGKFVMAFRCEEFDRATGISLGFVVRDVQVSVFPCSAPPPVIDKLPPLVNNAELVKINGKDGILACPGSNINFSMSTQSTSPTSLVFLEANVASIPGSTFTTTGGGTQKVTGEFNWTPTTSDVGEHTLIITAKDSTCSGTNFAIVLKNYTVLLLKVVPGLDAGPDLPICQIDGDSVQLFVRGADAADSLDLTWAVAGGGALTGLSDPTIHNPRAKPGKTTDYVVSVSQLKGECKSSDTVRVYIDETNLVRITPKNPVNPDNALVMCRPGYLQLEALLEGRPPKNNVSCGTGSPTLCSNPITGTVYGSSVYGRIPYDSFSVNSPILFNSLRTSKQQYLINRKDFDDAGIYSSTIRSISFETKGTTAPNYEYTNFRIFVKCTDKNQLSKDDGFENFGLTQVYSEPSVTFPDGVHTFTFSTPYNWDTTRNLIVQICYSENPTVEAGCGVTSKPPVILYVPTTYISGLKLAGDDQNVGSVCAVDKSAAILDVPARPMFSFTYCEAQPLDFRISWNQGEYLSDSTIAQPLAYIPKSTTFIVETIGRSNCVMRDTLEVYIPEHDMSIQPEDTSLCLGDKAPFVIFGGHYFKWYEYENGQYIVPSSVDEPTKGYTFVGPKRTTEYRVVVSDSVWCYDTLNMSIKILPLPDVRILNQDDTVVKYGQSFQLLASGARMYNWSPVSSLNNPNISYPIARPTEDTKYIVGGLAANGCRAFDTLHVIVDKRDNLFVPSAFSPNGDGKNDVFKVTNLSFQRIMEFRVFNRWGQEVFNTNDHRRGWDGTWEGKPQEMGTYSYLIRVAYPDGFVETYKGETTLIR
jgi:gliding motility-associated-like protein